VRDAVDRERGAPGRDEVELLLGELRVLGVGLDDVPPRLVGGVGVAAEGADVEGQPDGAPGERSGTRNRLDLVEVDDAR
jgi:hypothetical protein